MRKRGVEGPGNTTVLHQPARKKLRKTIAAWHPRVKIWVERRREEIERGRIHIPTWQAIVGGAERISEWGRGA